MIIPAVLIGLAYLFYVRHLDIYEKEPIWKLLLVFAIGGFASVVISLILYTGVEVNHTFSDAFLKIGIIEEASKLLALILVYKIIGKDFNEIVDGIIYITAICLGFAVIENIFYTMNSLNPTSLLIQRSVFSVLGHISFSGSMGIAFYIHKKVHKNYLGILLSLIIAAMAHGLYDGVLFQQELNYTFNFVFIFLVLMQLRLYKLSLSFSLFKPKFSEEYFHPAKGGKYLKCANCDENHSNEVYIYNELKSIKIEAAKCSNCNNMLMNYDNLKKTFKLFRPTRNLKKSLNNHRKFKRIFDLDKEENIKYNFQYHTLSAPFDTFGNWLKNKNIEDEKYIINFPVSGWILKIIGLRYLDKRMN